MLAQVHNHIVQNGIEIKEYNLVEFDVSLLGSGQLSCSGVGEEVKHLVTWIDPNSCCLKLYSKLSSDQVLMQQSPLALPKALKVHMQ